MDLTWKEINFGEGEIIQEKSVILVSPVAAAPEMLRFCLVLSLTPSHIVQVFPSNTTLNEIFTCGLVFQPWFSEH